MRPEMWAMISCPFSSLTRNMVFGRVSETVPSNSMTSSFAMRPVSVGGRQVPTLKTADHYATRAWCWQKLASAGGRGGRRQLRGRDASEFLPPRTRGLRRGRQPLDLGQEARARPALRAHAQQVRVLHLGIDQWPAPPVQPAGQPGKRSLGAAGYGTEHAFPEEHPAHRDAIDAAGQAWAVVHLHAVGVAEPMQLEVGLAHGRGDPGARLALA